MNYSFTSYHPTDSKEIADNLLQTAKITFLSYRNVVDSYPAADSTEKDYLEHLEQIEAEKVSAQNP